METLLVCGLELILLVLKADILSMYACGRKLNQKFYSVRSKNPQGKAHMVQRVYKDIIINGFEDMPSGGDDDFNDVVFTVKLNGFGLVSMFNLNFVSGPSK